MSGSDFDALIGLAQGMVVFGVLMLVLLAAITIATAVIGIVLLNKASRSKQELTKLEHSFHCTAEVADMRFLYVRMPNGTMANQYEIALQFMGTDALGHRAFLGIRTPQMMNLQTGTQTPVNIFAEPLIQPSMQAFDPARGADGKLPPVIEFCTFRDLPIDETGTVMLSADYQRALGSLRSKIRTQTILGWVLIGIAAMRFLSFLAELIF